MFITIVLNTENALLYLNIFVNTFSYIFKISTYLLHKHFKMNQILDTIFSLIIQEVNIYIIKY